MDHDFVFRKPSRCYDSGTERPRQRAVSLRRWMRQQTWPERPLRFSTHHTREVSEQSPRHRREMRLSTSHEATTRKQRQKPSVYFFVLFFIVARL
jgi:hypothetical protein